MIHLYVAPSCISCRNARTWLEDHHIDYQIHHLLSEPLSDLEIKHILYLTESGVFELISPLTRAYKELEVEVETLPLRTLYDLIRTYPGMLRKPIVFDERRLVIGYNEDELRCFLPKEESRREMRKLEEQFLFLDQESVEEHVPVRADGSL